MYDKNPFFDYSIIINAKEVEQKWHILVLNLEKKTKKPYEIIVQTQVIIRY